MTVNKNTVYIFFIQAEVINDDNNKQCYILYRLFNPEFWLTDIYMFG